ncbi:MAG: Lon protease family protein [Acidobacteriota bacterium]
MRAATELPATALYRRCEPAEIPFESTAEAGEGAEVIGQGRALEAIDFGIAMKPEGYNLFALGPHGVGKQTLLSQVLDRHARQAATPADWCYVANLSDPRRPRALQLPPGMGSRLRADVERAIEELRRSIRAAFDSEEYRTKKGRLVGELSEKQERAFADVQEHARHAGVTVVRTEMGTAISPLLDGKPADASDFQRLPKEQQAQIEAEMQRVGTELHAMFQKFHEWGHEHEQALRDLDRETAASVAHRVMDGVRPGYRELPRVLEYLAELEKDAVGNAPEFLTVAPDGLEGALRRALQREEPDGPSFRRYRVNVMIDNAADRGAPVVYEDNPTYANLVGRIEHVSQFGTLVTDFTLIRPGALHRARGGYLLLDAIKVLQQPFAWEALKRAVRNREIRMESLGEMLGLVPTVSLEPQPIPFDETKVILLGERLLYYLLATLDPDVLELFKVMADFEESMDRCGKAQSLYATLIAALVRKEGLRAFDRGAVARVIEHTARLAGDAEKLSVQMRTVVDLLRETDFRAGAVGRAVATSEDVQFAIDAQLRRAGRVRERLLEAIRRDTILIDTGGESVGQVNGLSVFQLGDCLIGHPTRITARVRAGKGEVVDIEREVELGGPIHSKGVLILGGFLGARYAPRVPLSLSASLVFEQSYASVEGDSASLAELCALLSAIADVPLVQTVAVTGSVNQHGLVQPIGGVNEKIEGFFDVCRERGLTGDQGVIIPKGNVKNLMLRRDVVAAVESGRFHVHAVADVDEAIELLTARPAGAPDVEGRFAEGTFGARVEARLLAFAEEARKFLGRS